MATARERLVRDLMAHVADHGIGDASLRDLAEAVGTSHRMLHYHFGGRDGLVAALVEAMEADQRDVLAQLADHAESPGDVVRMQWHELTRPEVLPFVSLFFELLAMATNRRAGTEGFLDTLIDPWLAAGSAVAERMGHPLDETELRLGIAVMRGLLVDVLATGEVAPATAALERHLQRGEGTPMRSG